MRWTGVLARAASAAGLALVVCLGVGAQAARAQFEIEEPEVEKGEIEIEYHGAYFKGLPRRPVRVEEDRDDEDAADDDDAADAGDDDDDEELVLVPFEPASTFRDAQGELENEVIRQGHEIEILGGITDWLLLGVSAEFEKERNEDGSFQSLELSEIGGGARIEIIPLDDERGGLGAALQVSYETSVLTRENGNRFRVGPLLKVAKGPFSATANLFLAKLTDLREVEIEDDEITTERTPDHWDFDYAWQVKRKKGRLGFGVEGFGTMQDVSGDVPGKSNPEKHRLGPTLYWTFEQPRPFASAGDDDGDGDDDEGARMEMTFGVLFGLNNETSDVALKWDFELEF